MCLPGLIVIDGSKQIPYQEKPGYEDETVIAQFLFQIRKEYTETIFVHSLQPTSKIKFEKCCRNCQVSKSTLQIEYFTEGLITIPVNLLWYIYL